MPFVQFHQRFYQIQSNTRPRIHNIFIIQFHLIETVEYLFQVLFINTNSCIRYFNMQQITYISPFYKDIHHNLIIVFHIFKRVRQNVIHNFVHKFRRNPANQPICTCIKNKIDIFVFHYSFKCISYFFKKRDYIYLLYFKF